MRSSINAIALALMCFSCLAFIGPIAAHAREPSSQPSDNLDVVQWRAHCDLEDGRRLLTDGGLLLDSTYLPSVPVPEKSVAPQGAQRLLASNTDHEFGLSDLERKA